jgi:hypothetical protein
MVKFFLSKNIRAVTKRRQKNTLAGKLVGRKADVPEEEEDDDCREDDNVSALELALNHSDPVAVDGGNKDEAKKLHTFGLLNSMMTRRKVNQTPKASEIKLRSIGEEERDDVMDEPIVPLAEDFGNDTKVEQSRKTDSFVMDSPLEVTVTPAMLTGLIFNQNSHSMKATSSVKDGKSASSSLKIKGYIRVVGKAAGVKIMSGSPKILKSYRVGTSTTTGPSPSRDTLVFSSDECALKSTGSMRIRLPAPSQIATKASIGKANYDLLTFEVGVLTPDGIFPLGTATYQTMLSKSNEMHCKPVLRVEPMYKGSLFQRRRISVGAPKSSASATINDADSCFRLMRKAKLSLSIDTKALSDEEYFAQKRTHELEKESMNINVDKITKSLSYTAVNNNQEIGSVIVPHDGTIQSEIQTVKSAPSGGIIMYLSDPLSCCSDRDVESGGEEEVLPEDVKTPIVTARSNDGINEEAQPQTAPNAEESNPEVESPLDNEREIDPPVDNTTENSAWCFLFPLCCSDVPKSKSAVNDQSDSRKATSNAVIASGNSKEISQSDTYVYDAVVQQRYLDEKNAQNEVVKAIGVTPSTSCLRNGQRKDEIIESRSDIFVAQDESVVGSRNCCMACFGDEDVENLRYSKLGPVNTRSETLCETNGRTDTIYDEASTSQSGLNESSILKQDKMANDRQLTTNAVIEKTPQSDMDNDDDDDDDDGDDSVEAVRKNLATPRVTAVVDTMSSSYTVGNDDESECSVSFSEDLDLDANVGCFQWMDAVSSEGLETDVSMSVVSSESQSDSIQEVIVVTANNARIPISKSDDVTTAVSIPEKKHKLQSNSIT